MRQKKSIPKIVDHTALIKPLDVGLEQQRLLDNMSIALSHIRDVCGVSNELLTDKTND